MTDHDQRHDPSTGSVQAEQQAPEWPPRAIDEEWVPLPLPGLENIEEKPQERRYPG